MDDKSSDAKRPFSHTEVSLTESFKSLTVATAFVTIWPMNTNLVTRNNNFAAAAVQTSRLANRAA
ncbi:MAG: hypothetical protein DWQ04_22690 [Chloroflexi bacterium]|nr:MAG: hypothetical protein DWQ04_22690 [Chloroflexota bacterium]